MRKLLLVALLLYNLVHTIRATYDYEDNEINKRRNGYIDDRRNYPSSGRKAFTDSRRDYGVYSRYEDNDGKYPQDKPKDNYPSTVYRGQRHYEDVDKPMNENLPHQSQFIDKDAEKKPVILNCERPHERYEPCFAGCASVSCDNPRDRLRACYPFCEPGCICAHPYVRDDRTHKCVLPEDCSRGLKGIPDLSDDF